MLEYQEKIHNLSFDKIKWTYPKLSNQKWPRRPDSGSPMIEMTAGRRFRISSQSWSRIDGLIFINSYASVRILKVQRFIFSFWLIRKKFSLAWIFVIDKVCFAIESIPVCRGINAILGFEVRLWFCQRRVSLIILSTGLINLKKVQGQVKLTFRMLITWSYFRYSSLNLNRIFAGNQNEIVF